jgi:glycosyltransferase involved in cell wall biosynthesis
MTPPAVSVVIPTRNRAGLLSAALASILERPAAARFEVVVVDNGSEDGTAGVLEAWAARDDRVRPMREDEVGRAPAVLAGIEAARGGLLLFTDDDVIVRPGWMDAYVAFFGRHPEVGLAGGPIVPIPIGPAWPAWFGQRAAVSLGMVLHDGERALDAGEHVWGANMAVRPELFARVGGFRRDLGVRGDVHQRSDPGMNEDIEFQYRVRSSGDEVWFCPEAEVGHRADPRSPGWCLRRGLVNGRNSYRRRPWPGMPIQPRRGPRSWRTAGAWAAQLVALLVRSASFRIRPDRGLFERAWLASWGAGWCMEDLLADDRRDRADRWVRAVTGRVTGVAAAIAGRA